MINYNIGDLIIRLTQVNNSPQKSQLKETTGLTSSPLKNSLGGEGCLAPRGVKEVTVPRNKENEQILRELLELGVVGPYSISKGGIRVGIARANTQPTNPYGGKTGPVSNPLPAPLPIPLRWISEGDSLVSVGNQRIGGSLRDPQGKVDSLAQISVQGHPARGAPFQSPYRGDNIPSVLKFSTGSFLGGTKLEIISKPGKRVYTNYKEIVEKLGNGYNTYIIRTSEGIVSSQTAIRRRIGGELLIKVSPVIS